jgi:hypothetical protein
MARELSKTPETKLVLEQQGRYFYKMALLEIVTLLNGAVEPAYYTSLLAEDRYTSGEVRGGCTDQTVISVENDIFHKLPANGINSVCAINVLQKRLSTDSGGDILDPIYGKEMDHIIAIEQSVVDGDYKEIYTIGQLKPLSLSKFQSLLRGDFAHGSYKDDIVFCETGGKTSSAISITSGIAGDWTTRNTDQSGATYLPASGDSTVKFNAHYIRLRYDPNNEIGVILNPVYSGTPADERIIQYNIFYQRMPNFPADGSTTATDGWRDGSTHTSRFVDLPDKHLPLLIKRIYTYCLIQLNQNIPEQLSHDIMQDYNQIYAMMDADSKSQFKGFIDGNNAQMQRSGR